MDVVSVIRVKNAIRALLQCPVCDERPAQAVFQCGCCLCCLACRAKTTGMCPAQAVTGSACSHGLSVLEMLFRLPDKLTTCSFCGLTGIDADKTSPYGPVHVCSKAPCRGPKCTGVGAGPHHENRCPHFLWALEGLKLGYDVKVRHVRCDGEEDLSVDPGKLEVTRAAQEQPTLPDLGDLVDINPTLDSAAAAADDLMQPPRTPVRHIHFPARVDDRSTGRQTAPATDERKRAFDYNEEDDDTDDTDYEGRLTLRKSKDGRPLKKRRPASDETFRPGRPLPAGVTC